MIFRKPDFVQYKPNAGGKASFTRDYNSMFFWKNAMNAIRHEPLIKFNYFEVPNGTTDAIPRYMDWPQDMQFADNTQDSGEIEICWVSGDAFYDNLDRKLD